MRHFLIYLAVVTFLFTAAAAGDINVLPGHVYEVNLLVQYPLPSNTAWAGVYGDVSVHSPLSGASYPGPFGYFSISPALVKEANSASVQLVSGNKLEVSDKNNWYIALSTNSDVNFDDLRSSCDVNVDSVLDGNFCGACLPSRTFSRDVNIYVRGREYCAREAILYGNVPAYLLLDANNDPVFLGKIGSYSIMAATHDFGVLLNVPSNLTEYVYLVRANIYCGDGVCDSGEMSCSDCKNLVVTVSPTSSDANVGQRISFSGRVFNNGFYGVTVQSLSVNVLSGDANAISYSFSYPSGAPPHLVPTGADWNFGVSVSASSAGDYTLQVVVTDVFGSKYVSNPVTLHVATPAPPPEQNVPTPPAGGAGEANAPTPETNQVVKLKTGGYYVPWAHCISYVKITGPDRVNSKLEENVVVDLYVQNGGTCDENIDIDVASSPEENFVVIPRTFELKKGMGKTIVLNVVPKRPGLHLVTVSAKGLVSVDHKMQLFVSNELASEAEHWNCKDDIAILAPDKLVVQEGESIGSIIVRNMGTCRDDVRIFVQKLINGSEVPIDQKKFKLSGGESYTYNIPTLAAGKYKITVSAGENTHVSEITVTPKPLVGGVSGLMSRAGVAVFAILLLVLIFAAGYVRYRYLS